MRKHCLKPFIVLFVSVVEEAESMLSVKFRNIVQVVITDFGVQEHLFLIAKTQYYRCALTNGNDPLRIILPYLLWNEGCEISTMKHVVVVYLAEIGTLNLIDYFCHHEVVLLIKSRILD